jgi:LacI family transcriptional regulator
LVRRLGESDGPTAVFATNDAAAIDLLRACADAGLDVPGDVSVAGYDDMTMAALWRPGLTSLSQPLEAMARLAVDDVVTRAEGRTADRHDILLGELAVRGTTGPARA